MRVRKMLEATYKAIHENFPGKDNFSLRNRIIGVAKSIVEGRNLNSDLLGISDRVALSNTGLAGLKSVNKVFLSELLNRQSDFER